MKSIVKEPQKKEENKMKIGSHVGNSGIKMLIGSVEEALSYNANCMMVYLGAPQNTFRKKVEELNSEQALKLWIDSGNSIDDIIIHAPYIVNLASNDEIKRQFAIDFLTNEVKIATKINLTKMVFHPGNHVGAGEQIGIAKIADGINQIINNTPDSKVIILLETMAGKGTECGKTFEEIKQIIDSIYNKERIGVCLDTCHINDGGYDLVNNYNQVINEFDQIIGLEYLQCVHVNDSKNTLNSHKDRHENIGFGTLGFDTIMQIFNDERLVNIPKILETPYIPGVSKNESYAPYKYEIEMIKSKTFNPNLKEDILNQR